MLDEEPNERAVIGGNNPPPDLPYDPEKLATCEEKAREFADAAGDWISLGRFETAEQAEKATDFVAGGRALLKKIQATQKAAKEPWAAKATAAFDAFKPAIEMLTRSNDAVLKILNDWLERERVRKLAEQRAEQERVRREAEEAKKRAAEAAARGDIAGQVEAEAALKTAEKAEKKAAKAPEVKVGSATGAGRTISQREVRSARITNQNLVYMHFRDHPDVVAVLQRLADAEYRAKGGENAKIPGAELHVEMKAA